MWMYSFMTFLNTCIELCNYNYNQDTELFYRRKDLPQGTFSSHMPPTPGNLTSVPHLYDFDILRTMHNSLESHPGCCMYQ